MRRGVSPGKKHRVVLAPEDIEAAVKVNRAYCAALHPPSRVPVRRYIAHHAVRLPFFLPQDAAQIGAALKILSLAARTSQPLAWVQVEQDAFTNGFAYRIHAAGYDGQQLRGVALMIGRKEYTEGCAIVRMQQPGHSGLAVNFTDDSFTPQFFSEGGSLSLCNVPDNALLVGLPPTIVCALVACTATLILLA